MAFGVWRYQQKLYPGELSKSVGERTRVRACSRRPSWCRPDQATPAASRKRPSFAVARNYGIGSSSLKAAVNAFERLHIVQELNSSCCGLK